jgi:hypothetical protein
MSDEILRNPKMIDFRREYQRKMSLNNIYNTDISLDLMAVADMYEKSSDVKRTEDLLEAAKTGKYRYYRHHWPRLKNTRHFILVYILI